MRVTSSVRINHGRIRELSGAAITALEKTTKALQTEVVQAQVMPRDTGALQNEGTFPDYSESKSGRTSIASSTAYARRLYYHPEYQFKREQNPNAKGKWFEDWLPGGSEDGFAKKAFKEFYKREAGL